jgi:hypothetical protein
LPTVRLLALMLLIVAHAAAQNHSSNILPREAPGDEARDRAAHDDADPAGGSVSTSTPPVSFPDAPVAHRVIDKKFIAVMGALGGAESLRFTTRRLVVEREFAAGAPWVTRVPSNSPMVARDAGIFAAELFVTYEFKKPHSWLPGDKVIRKLWWTYPAAMVVLHIKNGVGNIRTQGPGGCTSVECAMQSQ